MAACPKLKSLLEPIPGIDSVTGRARSAHGLFPHGKDQAPVLGGGGDFGAEQEGNDDNGGGGSF